MGGGSESESVDQTGPNCGLFPPAGRSRIFLLSSDQYQCPGLSIYIGKVNSSQFSCVNLMLIGGH